MVRGAFQLLLVLLASFFCITHTQCMRAGGEAKQDATPMPRLRGNSMASDPALPPFSGNKPAGCAMPLALTVSAGQRKKRLALGISVRTGIGDSEEFETDTLDFIPGSDVNVTVPIVPCGETLIGLIMRVVGNQTGETLLLDKITSSYMGAFQRSTTVCGTDPFAINKFKALVELAPAV